MTLEQQHFSTLCFHVFCIQPCKIYMKPEDLQFMLSEMVQRSEQLFFTPVESMDERLFHLPLFLEALASIVKEVDEVSSCNVCWYIALVGKYIPYFLKISPWRDFISRLHLVRRQFEGS